MFFNDLFSTNLFDLGYEINKIGDGEYCLEVSLPGYNKDQVTVKKVNNHLKISLSEKSNWVYWENKTFLIPDNIDSIEAKMKDGILTVLMKEKKKKESIISIG